MSSKATLYFTTAVGAACIVASIVVSFLSISGTGFFEGFTLGVGATLILAPVTVKGLLKRDWRR